MQIKMSVDSFMMSMDEYTDAYYWLVQNDNVVAYEKKAFSKLLHIRALIRDMPNLDYFIMENDEVEAFVKCDKFLKRYNYKSVRDSWVGVEQ